MKHPDFQNYMAYMFFEMAGRLGVPLASVVPCPKISSTQTEILTSVNSIGEQKKVSFADTISLIETPFCRVGVSDLDISPGKIEKTLPFPSTEIIEEPDIQKMAGIKLTNSPELNILESSSLEEPRSVKISENLLDSKWANVGILPRCYGQHIFPRKIRNSIFIIFHVLFHFCVFSQEMLFIPCEEIQKSKRKLFKFILTQNSGAFNTFSKLARINSHDGFALSVFIAVINQYKLQTTKLLLYYYVFRKKVAFAMQRRSSSNLENNFFRKSSVFIEKIFTNQERECFWLNFGKFVGYIFAIYL